MSDLTKETVAEAMSWRHLRYIISPESLADLDTYHDPDEVDSHIDTLQALCRAQHDILDRLSTEADMWQAEAEGASGLLGLLVDEAMRVLRLMPTEDT